MDIADHDLYSLFINDTVLLDVRAPIEFNQGAFPTAYNIPLLDDQQRHEIGLKYKNEGQDKAIELGLSLISGEVKERRLFDWSNLINSNTNIKLYCFRGGLRSRTTQNWLAEQGLDIDLIPGGYKRMRRYLLDVLEQWANCLIASPKIANQNEEQLLMLAGRTGTGKTKVLNQFRHAIDLEGIANHRGSSFGHYTTPQPSQINFENDLAIQYLKFHANGTKKLLLEDEGRLIGRIAVPESLYKKMQQSPMVLLECSVQERVETTLNDYIISNYNDFIDAYPDDGQLKFKEYLLNSLSRIQKRLGGVNYEKIKALMEQAIEEQLINNDINLHREWIGFLMTDYYDPMYDYQLAKKQERIIFKGNEDAVTNWLTEQDFNHPLQGKIYN